MSKKLLLTAGAVVALAFAGAASAGDLTAGSRLSGRAVNAAYTVGGVSTTAATYPFANERILPANGLKTAFGTAANNFTFGNLTNPFTINAEATGLSFVATYNLSGPASFADVTGIKVAFNGAVVGGVNNGNANTIPGTSVTPILSNGGTTLQLFVTVNNTGGETTLIDSVSITDFNVALTGKQTVALSYNLGQVIGGSTVALDSSTSTNLITVRSAFASFFSAPNASTNAALNNFTTFADFGNASSVSSGAGVLTNSLGLGMQTSNTYVDLAGTVAQTSLILSGAEVTVTGSQLKALQGQVQSQALPGTATNTAATWTVAQANLAAINLRLLQPTPAVTIEEGLYTYTVKPTFQTGYTRADATGTFLTVGLQGTHFWAPWFGLGGTAANSQLRIGNNASTATGRIVVELRAVNTGASPAANTRVSFDGVPAGRFWSISGEELRTAFGTDARNGDLRVSILSTADSGNVSAKIRTTQPGGQIFENSLDVLRPLAATAASLTAVQTALQNSISGVATTVNTINTNVGAPAAGGSPATGLHLKIDTLTTTASEIKDVVVNIDNSDTLVNDPTNPHTPLP